MSHGRLTEISITNFKCFKEKTTFQLTPLNIIIGRNNSGKSTIIQALLLLRQTLAEPKQDVVLKLMEGDVDAFNLRELTHGWPSSASEVQGPIIELQWVSRVDTIAALEKARDPNREHLANWADVPWLKTPPDFVTIKSTLQVSYIEINGSVRIKEILATACREGDHNNYPITRIDIRNDYSSWVCQWNNNLADRIEIALDHFIPHLQIDRNKVGPRLGQRAWHNAYLILFEPPLDDLKSLLLEFHYLGAQRGHPPSLYRPATEDIRNIGADGMRAAQLLHRSQNESVHYLAPISMDENGKLLFQNRIIEAPLIQAVQDIMHNLSISTPLKVFEIESIGFQLKFGQASLSHVGRGLGYLLPVVILGLYTDPLRFTMTEEEMDIDKYSDKCHTISH
ncbi:MAG: AAA family ATPase, partial [Magnetococcales bacterium]|nr:AAA family ATPase [Magnetococcales bacterium]